jgi:prolipoprotein diacylglyceryltransferase
VYVTVEVLRYATADVSATMGEYLAADDRGRASASLSPDELEGARRVAVGYDFVHDPLKMLMIWQGGLVMYGGLLGGVLLGVWSARKHGLDPWNSLDSGLVCGFAGLVLGRWGCLLVGDDYGRVVPEGWTDSARPISFGNGGEVGLATLRVPDLEWLLRNPESLFDHELAGKTLWATQVWMSANALFIALLGYLWLRRRRHTGVPAALMLLQYAVCRCTIEAFRGDEVRGVWFGGRVSTSQILSAALFALASWMLFARLRSPERPRPA